MQGHYRRPGSPSEEWKIGGSSSLHMNYYRKDNDLRYSIHSHTIPR